MNIYDFKMHDIVQCHGYFCYQTLKKTGHKIQGASTKYYNCIRFFISHAVWNCCKNVIHQLINNLFYTNLLCMACICHVCCLNKLVHKIDGHDLRNKTCSPCLHNLVKTKVNIWENSRVNHLTMKAWRKCFISFIKLFSVLTKRKTIYKACMHSLISLIKL